MEFSQLARERRGVCQYQSGVAIAAAELKLNTAPVMRVVIGKAAPEALGARAYRRQVSDVRHLATMTGKSLLG